MKKVYMQPVATAFDVVTGQMIAESVQIVTDPTKPADKDYSGGGDAKEFDFDDEEDENLW